MTQMEFDFDAVDDWMELQLKRKMFEVGAPKHSTYAMYFREGALWAKERMREMPLFTKPLIAEIISPSDQL